MAKIKILTLFGGIGAPEKALINLGIDYKQIDYVEIDEDAVRTFNALYHDLNKNKPQSVVGWNFRPDILFHGSPCQDFSRAGLRWGGGKEDETRSSLLFETIKIIENMGVWKPRVVIWENVKGVLDKDMKHAFNDYLDEMQSMGYNSTFKVLNAIDFGIPQTRERIFVVSTLEGYFNFELIRERELKNIYSFLEIEVHERYTITAPSMLKNIEGSSTFIDPSKTNFKGRIKVIEDSVATISTKQDRNPNAGVIKIDEDTYRYLTERECWRLMGFSDEDYNKASKEHPRRANYLNRVLYHQAGNSIVVQVIEAIFEQLFEQEILVGVMNE